MNEFKKTGWDSFQEILNVKKDIRSNLIDVEDIEQFFYSAIESSQSFIIARNSYIKKTDDEKILDKDFTLKIDKLYYQEIEVILNALKEIKDNKWELSEKTKESLETIWVSIKWKWENSSLFLDTYEIWNLNNYSSNKRIKILESLFKKKWSMIWKFEVVTVESEKTFFWYQIVVNFNFDISINDLNSIKNHLWMIINNLNSEIWNLRYKFFLKYDTFFNESKNIIIQFQEDLESKSKYELLRLEQIKSVNENISILENWFYEIDDKEVLQDPLLRIWLWEDFKHVDLDMKDLKHMLIVWNERSWKTHFLRNLIVSSLSRWFFPQTKYFVWDIANSWKFKEFKVLNQWNNIFQVETNKDTIADFLKFIFDHEFPLRKRILKREFIEENWQVEKITTEDRLKVWLQNIFIFLDWVQFNNPNSEIKQIIEKWLLSNNFFSLDKCWIHLIITSSNYKWKQYVISKDLVDFFTTRVTFKNTKDWYSNLMWDYKVSTNSIHLQWMWDWIILYNKFSYKLNELTWMYNNFSFNDEYVIDLETWLMKENAKKTVERFQSSYITDAQVRSLISQIYSNEKIKQEVEKLLESEE